MRMIAKVDHNMEDGEQGEHPKRLVAHKNTYQRKQPVWSMA